jgi:hypothetical protein
VQSDTSGLNLHVAAIILWNTTYLQRAVDHLRDQGHHPAPNDLAHDVGSARMLESLGFEALASTSAVTPSRQGGPTTLSLGMTCWSTSQLWPTASICP